MRTEILAMGVIISLAGVFIIFYKSFLFLGERQYPYAIPGAIVLLIGLVSCVTAFAIPSKQKVFPVPARKVCKNGSFFGRKKCKRKENFFNATSCEDFHS